MATQLTINTTPTAIAPTYRPVNWNVTSADGTIVAVRADIYIGGTYSSTIDGVQQLGSSDIFDFDVRKIMQSDLVSELRTNITTFQVTDAVTSAKTIKLRLFEILLTGGVHTHTWAADGAGTNYLESSTVDVVNMATQHQEVLADWTVDDATKELLTLRSDNNSIPRGVPFQVGFLSGDTDFKAEVIEYNAGLGVLATNTSGVLAALTSSKGIIEIPVQSFNASTAFIDLKLEKDAVGDRSITYRYKVIDYCDKFTIFWQNHLGDFDHFDFGNTVKEGVSTKNQKIEKPLPTSFNVEDRGLSHVSSRVSTKIKVTTDSLSASELLLIADLIRNHTVVYKWDSLGSFLGYIITSHTKNVADNDKLINTITITLAPSNDHIAQIGD